MEVKVYMIQEKRRKQKRQKMEEEKILNAVLPPTARWSTQNLEELSAHGKKGGGQREREKGNIHRGSALV